MGVSGGIFLGGQAISFPIFAQLGDVKNLMCKYSLIKGMQLKEIKHGVRKSSEVN